MALTNPLPFWAGDLDHIRQNRCCRRQRSSSFSLKHQFSDGPPANDYGVELEILLLHARQDVVARSVQDPTDRFDAVARQPVPQRANDRNPAADAGLESNPNVIALRCREEFAS